LSDIPRNRNHNDVNIETPVLINPEIEDPRDHIRFINDELIYLSERGRLNIDILGLQHADFKDGRRKTFIILTRAKESIDSAIALGFNTNHPILIGILQTLREAILPDAEFSSMAIDLLSEWPHL
jgi:hypothetical protein